MTIVAKVFWGIECQTFLVTCVQICKYVFVVVRFGTVPIGFWPLVALTSPSDRKNGVA